MIRVVAARRGEWEAARPSNEPERQDMNTTLRHNPNTATRPTAMSSVQSILVPRTYTGAWSDVDAAARAAEEPLFVPVSVFADDRGWSMMNLMAGALKPEGQINYTQQYPNVVKAWHRHERQTDFWVCVNGNIKAGVFRESDGTAWKLVFGEKKPGVLVIPPPLWHGVACVGSSPAGLLYYVTQAYNTQRPDEQRREWDSVEGFPWAVQHG